MDTNEIINQLREENERLKSQLVAVQDSVVHGKCANSEPCATFCEAIATRKMFKQLQVERDALAAQVEAAESLQANAYNKGFIAGVDAGIRAIQKIKEGE